MENESVQKIKVLIVDDSDIVRHSLKHFFQDYDCEVITADNGLDGIQKAVENRPSLIFLDLMMPNIDGVKVIKIVKVMVELQNIPIIVISGNTNRTNVLASIEAGADRVISKPLQKEIIIRTINDLLGIDFLPQNKKKNFERKIDNKEIREHLLNLFMKSFPEKEKIIKDCLTSKKNEELKHIAHEIKGAGGTIGYTQLTFIGAELERELGKSNIKWSIVEFKFGQIISIVKEIEKLNSVSEK